MSLSTYCKQKDRLKEELRWKRLALEELEDSEIFQEIKQLESDIEELETEWEELHNDSTPKLDGINDWNDNYLIGEISND
jgi:hypothetical protein